MTNIEQLVSAVKVSGGWPKNVVALSVDDKGYVWAHDKVPTSFSTEGLWIHPEGSIIGETPLAQLSVEGSENLLPLIEEDYNVLVELLPEEDREHIEFKIYLTNREAAAAIVWFSDLPDMCIPIDLRDYFVSDGKPVPPETVISYFIDNRHFYEPVPMGYFDVSVESLLISASFLGNYSGDENE